MVYNLKFNRIDCTCSELQLLYNTREGGDPSDGTANRVREGGDPSDETGNRAREGGKAPSRRRRGRKDGEGGQRRVVRKNAAAFPSEESDGVAATKGGEGSAAVREGGEGSNPSVAATKGGGSAAVPEGGERETRGGLQPYRPFISLY
ncbi:hypothetical protein ACMD2_24967 [Ananas comosus]|uniref:Uncharacterized protein n=1 Tax=Ananas comosus TaxID=4615 RepID=A0A199UTC3_ANACO|nr:hypothetical protein ACMD2_24967 [Ananas comosus]